MKNRTPFRIWIFISIMFIASQSMVFAQKNNKSSALPTEDVVAEWHREAARLTVLPASNLAPVQQTRAMAIVQVSVSDAVNGLTKQYETYAPHGDAPVNASAEAAAIAASHYALRNLFPTQATNLDTLYLASLAARGLTINDPGVAFGEAAAARILALRANDGAAQAQFPYSAPGAGMPGVWQPLTTQPALLPGWGSVAPWVLRSSAQFRPDTPPALDGEQYARDYNEIKEIGALNSTTRTADQTQAATFWLASPVAVWSQVLAQLNAANDLSLSQRARLFGLMYLSSADSSIACWEAKFEYNFWRPQPAIRRGAEDGNEATTADPTWTPLFATPRHPEYPSGHTANSTAMVAILQYFFGSDPGLVLSATVTPAVTPPQPPITRRWNSFGQGLDEVIDARIYSGIHFRTADEVGSKLGSQIARFVFTHALRPCRGRGSRCLN